MSQRIFSIEFPGGRMITLPADNAREAIREACRIEKRTDHIRVNLDGRTAA